MYVHIVHTCYCTNNGLACIIIITNLVLDFLAPVSVDECVARLLKHGGGRTDVRYHDSHAVTPQGVLEEACQLGVTIVDEMGRMTHGQCIDAVGQGEQ